jgi:small multidrug resistance pump
MTWHHLALALGILLGLAAQLILKHGAMGGGSIVAQFLSPWTIGGLALYGIAAFFYVLALRAIPVSVAFPSVALSYVLVALLGNLWFGEAITVPHVGGIVLIVIGVGLLHAF